MTSAFNSNDAECINRDTEHEIEVKCLDEIWNSQRLNECTTWIDCNQFKKVSTKQCLINSIQ